jgi:hypothetical protein
MPDHFFQNPQDFSRTAELGRSRIQQLIEKIKQFPVLMIDFRNLGVETILPLIYFIMRPFGPIKFISP